MAVLNHLGLIVESGKKKIGTWREWTTLLWIIMIIFWIGDDWWKRFVNHENDLKAKAVNDVWDWSQIGHWPHILRTLEIANMQCNPWLRLSCRYFFFFWTLGWRVRTLFFMMKSGAKLLISYLESLSIHNVWFAYMFLYVRKSKKLVSYAQFICLLYASLRFNNYKEKRLTFFFPPKSF